MTIENPTVKSAYKFIKQHDPFIADRLMESLRSSGDAKKRAVNRRRERKDEYHASVWQRLTLNESDVLRQFDYAIEDKQTFYYSCENDIVNEAERIEYQINSRKESEIESGNFVYYIVDLDTNVRKTENDIPIIYANKESAEYDCEGYDTVISIAEYDRIYGSFMED